MSRDIRDPFVVYNAKHGYTDIGFTVVPNTTVRLGPGHYAMIPVLNEQAGDALIATLKRHPDVELEIDRLDKKCAALALLLYGPSDQPSGEP